MFSLLCEEEQKGTISCEDSLLDRLDWIIEHLSPESTECQKALQKQKDIVAHYQGE